MTVCALRYFVRNQTDLLFHIFYDAFFNQHHYERNLTMTERKTLHDKAEALSSGINDKIQDLVREAKPLLHQVADKITDHVSELSQQSLDSVYQVEHDIKKRGLDLIDHASHLIRYEPLKAMMIAAGIGAATVALVGLLARPHHQPQSSSH